MRKPFNKLLYQKAPVNELIVFGVYFVLERKNKCIFEDLTRECFTLFPEAFCLAGNINWPDTRKLDRPLRALRNKKLLAGDPKTHFTLTKAGRQLAEQTSRRFRQSELFK